MGMIYISTLELCPKRLNTLIMIVKSSFECFNSQLNHSRNVMFSNEKRSLFPADALFDLLKILFDRSKVFLQHSDIITFDLSKVPFDRSIGSFDRLKDLSKTSCLQLLYELFPSSEFGLHNPYYPQEHPESNRSHINSRSNEKMLDLKKNRASSDHKIRR